MKLLYDCYVDGQRQTFPPMNMTQWEAHTRCCCVGSRSEKNVGGRTIAGAILACALLYGRLAEKYTARKLIAAGIIIYTFITFISSMIPLLQSRDHRLMLFWALAMLIATSQGGVQSLSRSFFGKLIPKENSA